MSEPVLSWRKPSKSRSGHQFKLSYGDTVWFRMNPRQFRAFIDRCEDMYEEYESYKLGTNDNA